MRLRGLPVGTTLGICGPACTQTFGDKCPNCSECQKAQKCL